MSERQAAANPWPTKIRQDSLHNLRGENGTSFVAQWHNGIWICGVWGSWSHTDTVGAGVVYLGPYKSEAPTPRTVTVGWKLSCFGFFRRKASLV